MLVPSIGGSGPAPGQELEWRSSSKCFRKPLLFYPPPRAFIPAAAVQTTSGTSRVFIVNGDRVEERIVTTVQAVGDLVEVTKGLKAGERVATANVAQLADGMKVS